MEYKNGPQAVKAIDDRTVTGVGAVHGNIDSYDDRSHPGSFAETIKMRLNRSQRPIKFLWSHNASDPPVAAIVNVKEITRDELPPAILEIAPDATGGVEVTRRYLDTERGNEILTGLREGAIDEMSYAYDPIRFGFTKLEDGRSIRELYEIKVWEFSDVVWGANPATLGAKNQLPPDVLLKQLETFLQELKAGARHSAADRKLLNAIHHAVVDLGATLCAGKLDEDADDAGDKSRAGQLAAVPLTQLFAQIADLEISLLRN